MKEVAGAPLPGCPKLRALDVRWFRDGANEYVVLRDPLGLADQPLAVSTAIAPILALCDGTRDPATIRAAAELRAGLRITPLQLEELLQRLDEALLLENEHFRQAQAQALQEYRAALYRPPALAGKAYPEEPWELERILLQYQEMARSAPSPSLERTNAPVLGLLSPHIDFARGGPVYARAWEHVGKALSEAEVVVVLGTDHVGGPGQINLTHKSYVTPLGVSPTDTEVVDALAAALGPEAAFANELHHRNEHSIELATVWLHHFLGGRQVPMVPVLCGSSQHLLGGDGDPAEDKTVAQIVSVLDGVLRGRRGFVVAAGDLAHVGPAFGDAGPLGGQDRARLAAADQATLVTIRAGDAASFFADMRQDGDARRYCGLTPIYLALRLMESAGGGRGRLTGYDQCPADPQGSSLVSVAGVVFHQTY